MMNPDGVIIGNSRCTILGYDMNRKWNTDDLNQCPEVYYVKQILAKLIQKREVTFFIDLHGHS